MSLSKQETERLLHGVAAAFNTQINVVLLTALVQAFSRWTGQPRLLVDMEGHGREALFKDIDVSRTVGWFTSLFPVLLDLGAAESTGEALTAIRKQVEEMPGRGIGYGLLRYLSEDASVAEKLRALPQPEVSFNYMGRFDQVLSDDSAFRVAPETCGPSRSPRTRRANLIEVSGGIADGRLQMAWTYAEQIHRRETIEELVRGFVEVLRSIISHSQSPGSMRATPGPSGEPPVITIASRDGELPLSFAQQRLWFLDKLEPENFAFNAPAAVDLNGSLSIAALDQTLSEVVRRHEVLRTIFPEHDGRPIQVITAAHPMIVRMIDLSDLGEEDRQSQARRIAREEVRRPFDLAAGPLFRAWLLRHGKQQHSLLFTIHHMIDDGWSMSVLMQEVSSLYGSFCTGAPSPLADLPIQYADFAVWQRNWLRGEVLREQLSYWQRQLHGATGSLDLPFDRPRKQVRTYSGDTRHFVIPAALTEALKALSRQQGVTLFMSLLAVFKTLLHRYTGQDDVVVGAPIVNRSSPETEGLIGLFINTLALRTWLGGNPNFIELLGRIREVTLGAYTYREVPFELIVESLQIERRANQNPLFQVWFFLKNVPSGVFELPGLRLKPGDAHFGAAQFDLIMAMNEVGREVVGNLTFNTDLFNAETIDEMVRRFMVLLESLTKDPGQRILDVQLTNQARPDQAKRMIADGGAGQAEDQFNF
jgi:non-ribosomal peptide synthase protein (TIGR01720 family)